MEDYTCPKCRIEGKHYFNMVAGQLDNGRDIEHWRCLFCGATGTAFSELFGDPSPSVQNWSDQDEDVGF